MPHTMGIIQLANIWQAAYDMQHVAGIMQVKHGKDSELQQEHALATFEAASWHRCFSLKRPKTYPVLSSSFATFAFSPLRTVGRHENRKVWSVGSHAAWRRHESDKNDNGCTVQRVRQMRPAGARQKRGDGSGCTARARQRQPLAVASSKWLLQFWMLMCAE